MRTNGWLLVAAFALVVLVSAGLVSTSAFTSVTLNREATVSVTADDASLVRLVDGHPGGGLVEQTSGSTLAIDFTRGGAGGANANATIALGSPAEPIGDHAFRIEHRADAASDVTLSYRLDGTTGAGESGGPESLEFTFYHDDGDDGVVDSQVAVSENTGSTNATLSGVDPGDPVYATIEVDTNGLSSANDLSGTLHVTVAEGT